LNCKIHVNLPSGTSWGVCLSHDVDHLSLREHFVDPFLLRYILNVARQDLVFRFRPLRAVSGYWGLVLAAMGHDRWDVIGDVLEMERQNGVQSTWFVPVKPGLGIAFRPDQAARLVKSLLEAGQHVGLHGQSAHDALELAREANTLSSWIGTAITSLRMHYLRLTDEVLDGMDRARLTLDSTVMDRSMLRIDGHSLPGPYTLRERVVEIPLHIMDSTLFSSRGLGLTLADAKAYTRRLLERGRKSGNIVVINSHPNYYSRQSPDTRDWYRWLISEITSRSDVFITDFRNLVPRLELPASSSRAAITS
jgi:peptidoglycan/xylan/chitin deacetylase (PgdA/CDA1 family)